MYLRCCTFYRWFLDRIGGRRSLPCRTVSTCPSSTWPGRRAAARQTAARRAATHLAPGAGLCHPSASLARRARECRACRARAQRPDLADPALDTEDFGSWLTSTVQSARAVGALWDPVGVATLNAVAGDASLGPPRWSSKTGLLSDPGAADIGRARVPLGELHDRLARKALDSAGVRTEVRTRVTSVCS